MDDAGLDRFTISKFRKYIMVDSKPISIQIHEFQDFLRKSELTGCSFSENYKVQALVDALHLLGHPSHER